mmetsp:Transcript_78378/g.179324  ORF Transcript_78378/g.179324 Transcript_78378/m.179324 type:complete len:210 (-) Transcript_78378:50-679(-)
MTSSRVITACTAGMEVTRANGHMLCRAIHTCHQDHPTIHPSVYSRRSNIKCHGLEGAASPGTRRAPPATAPQITVRHTEKNEVEESLSKGSSQAVAATSASRLVLPTATLIGSHSAAPTSTRQLTRLLVGLAAASTTHSWQCHTNSPEHTTEAANSMAPARRQTASFTAPQCANQNPDLLASIPTAIMPIASHSIRNDTALATVAHMRA